MFVIYTSLDGKMWVRNVIKTPSNMFKFKTYIIT